MDELLGRQVPQSLSLIHIFAGGNSKVPGDYGPENDGKQRRAECRNSLGVISVKIDRKSVV